MNHPDVAIGLLIAVSATAVWFYRCEAHFAWASQGRMTGRAFDAEEKLRIIEEGPEMRIKLGDKARHAITGFEGIAVATVQYLTGCDQICLQQQGLDKEGQPFKAQYFDEPYVDLIETDVVPNRTPGRTEGCDIAPPSRFG